MRHVLFILGAAALVGIAVMAALPTWVLYPQYCDTYPTANGAATQPGMWCIDYDPDVGRYDNPPAGVPADVSRFATATAHPNETRIAMGAAAFALFSVAGWWAVRRRSRGIRRR